MFTAIFFTIVGVALGYFFKPQLDVVVKKVVKKLSDKRDSDDDPKY